MPFNSEFIDILLDMLDPWPARLIGSVSRSNLGHPAGAFLFSCEQSIASRDQSLIDRSCRVKARRQRGAGASFIEPGLSVIASADEALADCLFDAVI